MNEKDFCVGIKVGETAVTVSPGEIKTSVKNGTGFIAVPAKPVTYHALCSCLSE